MLAPTRPGISYSQAIVDRLPEFTHVCLCAAYRLDCKPDRTPDSKVVAKKVVYTWAWKVEFMRVSCK